MIRRFTRAFICSRQRIYALKLAEDPQFVADHQAFSEQLLRSDEAIDGLTAEQFAERYLSQHTD